MVKKFTSSVNLFVFLFLATNLDKSLSDNACGDWLPYKDEKCFKVIDDTLRTYDEAETACEKLENSPTLAIVHSQEEQDLLVNYLFKTLKKVENFWIGAQFSNEAFHWNDNSSFSYTNWDSRARHNKSNYCVQLLAEEVTLGKWIDGPCEKKNAVVCQKTQTWSMARLQESFLEARKQLTNSLAEANMKNDEANKKIANLEKNLIPIGFIYTQLPNEKTPTSIWPWMTWADVTSTYAGVFFRAEGNGSELFGQTQAENDHRVIRVEVTLDEGKNIFESKTVDVNTVGQSTKASDWIFTGDSAKEKNYFMRLRLVTSTGENRPRNMAVRIWRRTA